jgi:hypothetical protein
MPPSSGCENFILMGVLILDCSQPNIHYIYIYSNTPFCIYRLENSKSHIKIGVVRSDRMRFTERVEHIWELEWSTKL